MKAKYMMIAMHTGLMIFFTWVVLSINGVAVTIDSIGAYVFLTFFWIIWGIICFFIITGRGLNTNRDIDKMSEKELKEMMEFASRLSAEALGGVEHHTSEESAALVDNLSEKKA